MSVPTESRGGGNLPPSEVPSSTVEHKGHPPGLYVLFFTEMWERFSYYGMRALLVLYMVNYFKWTQGKASTIYKWYTALVFVTPILGGAIADYWTRHGKPGNKRAVVIGASLMAVGHFLMAFEATPIFYAALVLLILGNGMFKPNMSTQVGRLYPPNDARRDGAYTIFYMGINLGAFLSPIVCGWLRMNYGFHYGFAAAGVGMLIGLVTYLVGLRWVKEVSGMIAPAKGQVAGVMPGAPVADERDEPTSFPNFSRLAPRIVWGLGGLIFVAAIGSYAIGRLAFFDMIFAFIAVVAYTVAGYILSKVYGASRDRVMAIYVLGVFVVFFWMAFEQAGNAMNLWADQTTDRFVTDTAPVPSVLPPVAAPSGFGDALAQVAASVNANGGWWHDLWNPVSTEWFQSINAVAIVVIAPLFALLWIWLDRRKKNPSIATKMAAGVLLMSSAFAVMILAAKLEDGASETPLAKLPPTMIAGGDASIRYRDAPEFTGKVASGEPEGEAVPAQAGRLFFKEGKLSMRGVLADVERDRILRATVPVSFVHAAMELAKQTGEAKGERFTVAVTLAETPPGFDLRFAGFHPRNLHFDPASRTLTAENLRLADKDYKSILQAAADPGMRDAMNELYIASAKYKVGWWWLLWFYVLSTLGELCLSPVGLSMVSKLAPARFATMLMGMWLLTSFFGNFLAGQLGESWGTVSPTAYFIWLVVALGAASAVLFGIVPKVVKMMHGVN